MPAGRHPADELAAAVGTNGVGGHTPIYHAIGNQRRVFPMFEFLVERGADLAVSARLPAAHFCEDPVHKGRDHFFDDLRTLTPLGYARMVTDEHPQWRDASREVRILRERGAPERPQDA